MEVDNESIAGAHNGSGESGSIRTIVMVVEHQLEEPLLAGVVVNPVQEVELDDDDTTLDESTEIPMDVDFLQTPSNLNPLGLGGRLGILGASDIGGGPPINNFLSGGGRGSGNSNHNNRRGGSDRGSGNSNANSRRGGGGPRRNVGDPVPANITLETVGGNQEIISYLKRAVIFPLQHPEAFKQWGFDPPKGILFHGPPGTGKTLLAKALVNEIAKALNKPVAYYYHKGTESHSPYFGQSEENLRKLFDKAKKNHPSVIFMDEIDGLCPDRNWAAESSEAYVGIVTALLGLIDNITRGEIFLIGATNRLQAIDTAIRRPGRFDKLLAFSLPDYEGRKSIIRIHTKHWPKDRPEGELLRKLADQTNGFSGSDLEKLCADTLTGAIARCGHVASAVSVTEQDWMKARHEIRSTPTNVFGSTLYAPQQIPSFVSPLVRHVKEELMSQLKTLLPDPSKRDYGFDMLGMRSFLIWEDEFDSETYLHQVIMNAVLSDQRVSNIPIYVLEKRHLHEKAEHGITPTKAAEDIIKQAATSANPCILYCPKIADLNSFIATEFTGETTDTNFEFVKSLQSLMGTKALLLATGVGPFQDSKCIKDLFAGYRTLYKVRKATCEERKEFFLQIFEDLIVSPDPDAPPPKRNRTGNISTAELDAARNQAEEFKKLLDQVVTLTNNDGEDYVLKLFATLEKAKLENATRNEDTGALEYNFGPMQTKFEEILDAYHKRDL